jgi:hypothetical protein
VNALDRLKAALATDLATPAVSAFDLALAVEAINLLQRARKYIKRGPFDLFVEMDKNIAALTEDMK